MRQQKRKDDAVSPVIGVMLMLVVTIIIAAVITGFATDLSKDSEKTPTAFFEAQYADDKFTLKHKGGDPIPLKDLQLVLEQGGGVAGGAGQDSIIKVLSGANGDLSVRGQSSANAVVSTSDIIQVSDFPVEKETTALWTLTYTKTNGLVASGECPIL